MKTMIGFTLAAALFAPSRRRPLKTFSQNTPGKGQAPSTQRRDAEDGRRSTRRVTAGNGEAARVATART